MCKKMLYQPGERDMLMLQHTFGIELADGSKVHDYLRCHDPRLMCLGNPHINPS